MLYLILASLIWAFSFGLIKNQLAGLDPVAVASIRLLLAATVFLPFVFRHRMKNPLRHMALGAVQFGAMYIFYIASYTHLPAYAVALFTIFTPLYVSLLDDILSRRFTASRLLAVLIAIVGAGLAAWNALPDRSALDGIILLQLANLCFALGQVYYRRTGSKATDATQIGWMYLGAAAVTTLAALLTGGLAGMDLTPSAMLTLSYLGIIPTGLGFWLWNRGAARTSVARLAISNNLKIPLSILVAWLVFGEAAPYLRVILGVTVILWSFRMSMSDRTRRV